MGVLLLLTLLGGLAFATVLVLFGLVRGNLELAGRVLLVAAAGCLLYVGALVTMSHGSIGRTLSAGEELRFCGFYLDCHLSVAVTSVESFSEIGNGEARATPVGRFHVITLRASSNAARATLSIDHPEVYITDLDGRRFAPSSAGARALAATTGAPMPLSTPIGPEQAFSTRVVFDLPPQGGPYYLHVVMGDPISRAFEKLVIGDEDSLLRPGPRIAVSTHS